MLTVVTGVAGSGKSTLLRCINGLEPVQSGEVIVDGVAVHDPKANLRALRARMPAAAIIALTLYLPGFLHARAIEAGATACASIALHDNSLRELLLGLLPSHPASSP